MDTQTSKNIKEAEKNSLCGNRHWKIDYSPNAKLFHLMCNRIFIKGFPTYTEVMLFLKDYLTFEDFYRVSASVIKKYAEECKKEVSK